MLNFAEFSLIIVNNVGLGYEHPEFLNEYSAEVNYKMHRNSSDQLFSVLSLHFAL